VGIPRMIAQIPNLVVSGQYGGGLVANEKAVSGIETCLDQHLAIGCDGLVFPAFALGEHGGGVVLGEHGFEADPASVDLARYGGGIAWLFT